MRCKDGSSVVFSEGWRSVGAGKPDRLGWVISNEEGQPFRAIEAFTNSPPAKGLPFLVCESADRVAGYAFAAPWRAKPAYRHTVEDAIYLAPGHTGRGLGRRLLRALQEHCALAGLEQMIAVIADSGDPASAALHRACGFTDAGRLRSVGRKHGRLIDKLLLQCDLAAARS